MFNRYQRQCKLALQVGLEIITTTTPLVIATPTLAESTFYDVQDHWAKSCITQLAYEGIISGYPDGSFRPSYYMNRAEFAAIIDKAFPNLVQNRKSVEFVDVPVYYWAYSVIKQAYQTKFLSGYPGKVFKPSRYIPRSQVLVSLASGLNYSPTRSATAILNAEFADANTIPNYAKKGIAAATEKGFVVNYPNVKFLNPNKKATRAEVAAFLCQARVSSSDASVIPAQYIAGSNSF